MNDTIQLLHTFVDATALVLALVLVVNILLRSGRSGWTHHAMMGGVFAVGVFFTMSDPISLEGAGIFDMRGLLIGTAAAVLGPMVGLIALATGLIMRLNIGEPGLMAGFVGMITAFSAGLAWRAVIRRKTWMIWKKSVVLGAMITLQLVAIFAAPAEMWGALFATLLPYTFITNVIGAYTINHLVSGELSFLSESEAAKLEANTDHLTGLLNRRGFEMIYPDLARPVATDRGQALICFDVDRFKQINDNLGHSVGDRVLRFIAHEIGGNLRPNDVFARLGGDEFAIVLNSIDKKEAQRIAQRCRKVVEDGGFNADGRDVPVTISVGAVWMLEHADIDHFLNEADQALYAAKAKGRNMVVFRANTMAAGNVAAA